MSETLQLQEVLHKSVLSDFSGGLNGKEQCLPMAGWTVKDDSQIAKVIHESSPVPHDGRIGYDANELCMLWIPGEIALTCCDNGGNMYHKTRLTSKKSVTLAVDADILNMNKELLMDGDEIQSSLILVKRRYPVEIPVPRPSSKTGGGDETNMEMIHTTLLMVTAHCQLHIKIPGKEAVTVPTTEDILEYGDGHSSKLQHTTSVDSGYGGPVSPDIGGGDGRNLSEPGDRQKPGPFSHTNSQNESISTDGNDVPQMSTRSSVDSGLGDGTSPSEQTTASISEQTMTEQATSNLLEQTMSEQTAANLLEQTMSEQTAANLLEQTSHAIQVAEESNGTSFPVVIPHGSGIVDMVKTSGDIIENQPVEADGAKLKHSSSVESGYESAASLGLGIGDSASLSRGSVIKDTQNKSGVFENRSVETEAERGEKRLTGGVPESKKPGDVIDEKFVRASGAEGDNRAVGGVRELENAAMFRVQQEHIQEEFHKADVVGQLARGELVDGVARGESVEGVIGRPVGVESGDKDVDATINKEKLKKEDSQDEGIEEFKEPCEYDNYFDKCNCCDILLPYKEDSASPAVVKFCKRFRENHKQLKIRTFDDYHHLGLKDDHIFEAAWRASKILTYVTVGQEVAFREDLLLGHCESLGDKKDYRIIFSCVAKGCKKSMLKKNPLARFCTQLKEESQVPLTAKQISNIIEKREMTGKHAHEHLLEMEKPLQPSSPLPKNRRSPSGENRPHSDAEIEDFIQSETNTITRTKVFILCDNNDSDAADKFACKVRSRASGKTVRVSTPEDLYVHGLHKNQVGIEKSVKVLIYATQRYANNQSMIRKLDLAKAITEKERNSVIVVPKGMSPANYNGYKAKLHLASQLQTFFEDKDTDMKHLIAWLAEDGP